jgi:chromosome condensin MukBEF complex kleisin-like MukF subunit
MNEVRIRRAQQTTSNKAEEKWEESMDWIENNYNNLKYEIREKFDKIKGNVNNDNG